jgi:hypothetical protein
LRAALSIIPFNPFDDTIYTTCTFSTADLDTDEPAVAPANTPRVLDLPIVIIAAGVRKVSPVVFYSLFFACVPPLCNIAFPSGLRLRARIRVRIRRRTRAGVGIVLISVTNHNDSVVELSSTTIVLFYDSTPIELEGGLTSINGDSERLLHEFGFDIGDRILDLSPILNFTHSLGFVMIAVAF